MYSQTPSPPPAPARSRLALIGGALAIFLAAAGAAALIITRPEQGEEVSPPGTEEAAVAPPTASPAPADGGEEPPTATEPPTPTPTLAPYEHLVQPGETGLFILQLYGYRTLDVVPVILALNGIPSLENIQSGQTLLIPRQTPTPGPTADPSLPTPAEAEAPAGETSEGLPPGELPFGATSPPSEAEGGDPEDRLGSDDGRYWVHTVREGQTIASIARSYDSSVPCILQNNNFTFSGQDPVIFVGQNINVCIVVTLTPTPSPTGDPLNSTATPTPTPSPPLLLAPANGASFGRGEDVTLRWVATHALIGEQHYLVIAQDVTNNVDFRATTTANAFTLPGDLRPGIGGTAEFEWRVVVVAGGEAESAMISGLGEPRMFTWGG